MIKIVYDGNYYERILDKLKKYDEFIIMDYSNFILSGEKGFVYYLDNNDNKEKLSFLPRGTNVYLKNSKKLEINKNIYSHLIFIDSLYSTKNIDTKISINGDIESIAVFVRYISGKYNMCIGLEGEDWMLKRIFEDKSFKFADRLQNKKNQNLIVDIGSISNDNLSIYFWSGAIKELYLLREKFGRKLPINLYVVGCGISRKKFLKQEVVSGNYLGGVLNKVFWKTFWNKKYTELSRFIEDAVEEK
ncbi:MAG: hypothetical protein CSB16_01520 [Clostridiales bacterium]|nr:MAG: hypothetical protein CSB16_01520 [Clostridiales bacterium]